MTLALRNVLIIYGWVTVSVLWSAMLCEKMELELQTVTFDGVIHEHDKVKEDQYLLNNNTNSGNVRKQKKNGSVCRQANSSGIKIVTMLCYS